MTQRETAAFSLQKHETCQSIVTLKVGCVRACLREEVINGGSLSPFQRTAADGEGVWASGMSHTHNELACCAIQYEKRKTKTQTTKSKVGCFFLLEQPTQATRRQTGFLADV